MSATRPDIAAPHTGPDRAAQVRAVADYQRAALLARAAQLSDDARTVTGLTWGIAALERVIRACDGETDPARLGLPGEPAVVEQGALFG